MTKAVGQALPEQLSTLVRAHATGVLRIADEGTVREVVLVSGEIRTIRSNAADEEIGQWLVEQEVLGREELALALLGQARTPDTSVPSILLQRGLITQTALESASQALAEAILTRASAAAEAERSFVESDQTDEVDTLPNTTTVALLLVAARAVKAPKVLRSIVEAPHLVAWPSSSLSSLLEEVPLTPTEAFVISRLDGSRTVSELVNLVGLPEEEVVRTLYALRAAGVITVAKPPEDGPKRTIAGPPPVVDEATLRPEQVRERRYVTDLADRLPRLDHYAALGLTTKSTPHEVRRAWDEVQRTMAPGRIREAHLRDLRLHLEAITERARDAYAVLSDPMSRSRYDSVLKSIHHEGERVRAEAKERADRSKAARAELVDANLQRAEELLRQGELYLAIKLQEQACAIDPRPAELVRLAKLLLRNPLWTNRALATLQRAVELDRACVDAWVELAEFWRRRNRPERQRKALERALAADATHERARSMYSQLVGTTDLDMLLARLPR